MSPATLLSPRDVAFARAVREDGLLERLQARPRPVPPLASRPPRPSRGECSPGPPPGGPQERRRNVPAINRFPDASVDPTFFNELFHKRVPPAQSAAAHHPPPGAWTRWSVEDLFAAARDSSAEAMSRRLAEAASRADAREKRRLSPLAEEQGFGSRRCGDDDGAITYFNPSNSGAAPDYTAWKIWKEGCAAAVWKGCWASDDTPTSNEPTQIDVWTGAEWTGNNGGTNTNTTCTPWRSALSAIGYDTEWYTQMDEWRDALPRAKECVHSHGWSSYSVCQWPCIPDFCTPNDCPADTPCGPVPAGQCDHDWQCPSTGGDWTCPTSPPDCVYSAENGGGYVFSSNLAVGVVGSAEHDDKFVGGNSGYVKGGSYNAQGTEWSLENFGNLEIGFWTKLVVGCAAAATTTTSRARSCAHPPPAVPPPAPAGASMRGRTTSTCTSTRSCS